MIKLVVTIMLNLTFSYLVLADANEKYIEKTISHMNKLVLKNQFVKGTIYFQNDSLATDLLLFTKKGDINPYLFCIARLANDSFKVFSAQEIDGYRIRGHVFMKQCVNEESFFVKKIKSGRIDLYEKKGLPNDHRLLYYLKLPGYEHLFAINPMEKNVSDPVLIGNSKSGDAIPYYPLKGIPQKFREFIFTYLGDCETIKNLVDSEVYTINHIPGIVETYNNCFKN